MEANLSRNELLFNEQEANRIVAELNSYKELQIKDVRTEPTTKGRPIGLNTVNMLKIASSSLGMGPQYAMSTAEHLYLSGYLTYPRTESTSYPKNFDFKEIVE